MGGSPVDILTNEKQTQQVEPGWVADRLNWTGGRRLLSYSGISAGLSPSTSHIININV